MELLSILWIISPVILFIALLSARSEIKRLRTQPSQQTSPPARPVPTLYTTSDDKRAHRLENLILLRLELQRQLQAKKLTESRYHALINHLEATLAKLVGEIPLDKQEWERRRTAAWNLLVNRADIPLGPPPWQAAPPERVAEPPAVSATAEQATPPPVSPLPVSPPQAPTTTPPPQPAILVVEQPAATRVSPPSVTPSPAPRPKPAVYKPAVARERPPKPAALPPSAPPEPREAEWTPAEPGAFERLLRVVSGWPKLAIPFLVQNIGWFIGGFCLVAGTVFLVLYTKEFAFINNLVVFVSLFIYTAFLLWAGYQLRRKRPELVISSTMLMIIGMLLAPLNLATTTLLVRAAGTSPLYLTISLLATGVAIAAFYWAANLVGTLVDRSLQGRHPRLVVTLASLQLAAPLLAEATHWIGLTACQSVLLGLLGYGLVALGRDWVRFLFTEQRQITYYAAGLLVYSALVSFVHLTWAYHGPPLPAGYYGPFLIALSGCLFYVDAGLKDWVHKHPFLSRFSFILYGLSALAIGVGVWPVFADLARLQPLSFAEVLPGLITLALGAVLYGWITWRYLTLPPLYLLLACLCGCYGLVVLRPLPYVAYFLASLPGLAGLLVIARWAQPRSRTLALHCFGVFCVLLASLTGWSLYLAEPGWFGMTTALTASLILYYAIRQTTVGPLALNLPLEKIGLFVVILLAAVAIAYMPRWSMPSPAWGFTGLATLWTGLGLRRQQRFATGAQVFITSALLNLLLALGVTTWMVWPNLKGWEPIVLTAAVSSVGLWLSLGLRWRGLFYGVLLCWGTVGVLIKYNYLPTRGTGFSQLVLVLLLWLFLWWLNYRFPARLEPPATFMPPVEDSETQSG